MPSTNGACLGRRASRRSSSTDGARVSSLAGARADALLRHRPRETPAEPRHLERHRGNDGSPCAARAEMLLDVFSLSAHRRVPLRHHRERSLRGAPRPRGNGQGKPRLLPCLPRREHGGARHHHRPHRLQLPQPVAALRRAGAGRRRFLRPAHQSGMLDAGARDLRSLRARLAARHAPRGHRRRGRPRGARWA